MPDLRELYQEVILDHNRRPRNFGVLEGSNRKADGYNPLCGDKITIYLRIVDGMVDGVSFQGAGCAISKASASMMTSALKGKTIQQAREMFARFTKCAGVIPFSSITGIGKPDLMGVIAGHVNSTNHD